MMLNMFDRVVLPEEVPLIVQGVISLRTNRYQTEHPDWDWERCFLTAHEDMSNLTALMRKLQICIRR